MSHNIHNSYTTRATLHAEFIMVKTTTVHHHCRIKMGVYRVECTYSLIHIKLYNKCYSTLHVWYCRCIGTHFVEVF